MSNNLGAGSGSARGERYKDELRKRSSEEPLYTLNDALSDEPAAPAASPEPGVSRLRRLFGWMARRG